MKSMRGVALLLFYLALILTAVCVGCTSDTILPGSPSRLHKTTPYDDNTPTFTWDAAADYDSGVASYLIRMDGGSWKKVGNVTTYTWDSALSDGSHAFEVRAVDNQGNEGSASNLHFLCDTAPPRCPSKKIPAEGYSTNDTTLSFDWSDVSDASGVSYWLQIDNDSNFSSPWLSWLGLRNSGHTLTESEALVDGKYYWRVCAMDGQGQQSEWTEGWSFFMDTTPLSVPMLVSPTDWRGVNDGGSTMDWSDVSDPSGVTYQIRVYNSSWSVVLYKEGLTASDYTRTVGEALADGTYYWKVRAVDGVGNASAWTSAWGFKLDNTDPSLPVLVSPGDGANITSTPKLDWTDASDVLTVHYQVQVDDNSDFSSLVISKTWVTASEYTLAAGEALPAGTYYWRVKAVDGAGNESDWTGGWSFVVVP